MAHHANSTSFKQGHLPTRGFSGHRHTEEAKRKISIALMGHVVSEESRGKIRAALLGHCHGPMSEENKLKISLALKGKPKTEEFKRNLSIARTGVYTGERHPKWRGGRIKIPQGYIKVWSPGHPRADGDKYVFEHILVWEQYYGTVPEGYHVHHLNGVKDDNRIENLQVLKKGDHINQGKIYQQRILKLEEENKILRREVWQKKHLN